MLAVGCAVNPVCLKDADRWTYTKHSVATVYEGYAQQHLLPQDAMSQTDYSFLTMKREIQNLNKRNFKGSSTKEISAASVILKQQIRNIGSRESRSKLWCVLRTDGWIRARDNAPIIGRENRKVNRMKLYRKQCHVNAHFALENLGTYIPYAKSALSAPRITVSAWRSQT